jgi:hypothetical protein
LGLAAIGLAGIVIDHFGGKMPRPRTPEVQAPPALASIDDS